MHSPSEFEALLRGAARDDEPEAGSEGRALAALGLASAAGASVAGASAAGVGHSVLGTKASVGFAVGTGSKLASFAFIKWVGLAAVVIVGGAVLARGGSRGALVDPAAAPTLSASAPVALATLPTPPAAALPQAEPMLPTSRNVDTRPSEPASESPRPAAKVVHGHGVTRSVAAPSSERTSSERASSLSEELALVRGARAALAAGDGTAALQFLDRHTQAHPRGALADETSVLRIEALVARGDRTQALTRANAFVAERLASPYFARVERLKRRIEGEAQNP